MVDTIPTRVMVPMADLCNEVGKRDKKIAALEAERDEWKRRCEAIVEILKPAPDAKLQKMYAEDLHVEYTLRELYPLALAIAEGRDNG